MWWMNLLGISRKEQGSVDNIQSADFCKTRVRLVGLGFQQTFVDSYRILSITNQKKIIQIKDTRKGLES